MQLSAAPVSDVDPFSDAFLTDPYHDHDHDHEALREAGTVGRLERYGVWAAPLALEVR